MTFEKMKFKIGALITVLCILITSYIRAEDLRNHVSYDSNANITYVDTEGNIFSGIGTITFTDEVQDETFTILDRNLGATSNDYTSPDSYGYYFQWGNNYGFSNNSIIKYHVGKVDISEHGWNNPYVNNTLAIAPEDIYEPGDREYTNNINLRGEPDSDEYQRQGPCPAGYHVPDIHEAYNAMKRLRDVELDYSENKVATKKFDCYYDRSRLDCLGGVINSPDFIQNVMDALKIPFAGVRHRLSADIFGKGLYGGFWGQTRQTLYTDNTKARINNISFSFNSNSMRHPSFEKDFVAMPIRCFKNKDTSNTLILEYETDGGSAIQAQDIPIGSNAYLPGYTTKKQGKTLLGWSLTNNSDDMVDDITQLYISENDDIDQDGIVKVYAHWGDDESNTDDNDEDDEFKGITYNPNANITYTDTDGKLFENIGTITVSEGDETFTILDRNLGATSNNYQDSSSDGYIFQWGNNYGFSTNEQPKKFFSIQADTSKNGWNNPYVSDTFNTSDYRSINENLRGENESEDYQKQGPCPTGYHVPFPDERKQLINLFRNLNFPNIPHIYSEKISDSEFSTKLRNALYLPLAGFSRYYGGDNDFYYKQRTNGYYGGFNISTSSLKISTNYLSSDGTSIRCFKNKDTSNTLILEYETDGGSAIQAQDIPNGSNAYLPGYTTKKQGKKLLGWSLTNNSDDMVNDITQLYISEANDTDQDGKITKSPKMNVIDKDKFLQKIKDLGLFEEYADISRQNVNNLFLKSGKVNLSDFIGAVEQDITFSVRKQNKK